MNLDCPVCGSSNIKLFEEDSSWDEDNNIFVIEGECVDCSTSIIVEMIVNKIFKEKDYG